jgi:hypothetical protein
VLKAAGQFIVTAIVMVFLFPPSPAQRPSNRPFRSALLANEPIQTLGNDSLGETVKQFRIRYPKAVCGRITSLDINPQTLVHSESMDDTHCCLNDKDSLSEVSKFPILNVDDCAFHAAFSKGRLFELSYMLDVRSIQIVLDHFVKLYGPPTRMLKDRDTTQLTTVDWWQGMTTLWLHTATIDADTFAKYSWRKVGEPPLQVVYVDLWTSLTAVANG